MTTPISIDERIDKPVDRPVVAALGGMLFGMPETNPKADLHRYLQAARAALLWKLDGLSEYDIRRPMVPSGTNLLGLVKHLAAVEQGYFGATFDRPFPEQLPWFEDGAEPNADMWATADESRAEIIGLYERACAHSDATIEALDLDTLGHVPWWPADRSETPLHRILVHMIAETNRHVGPRRHRPGAHRRGGRAPGGQRQHGAGRRVVVAGLPGPTGAGGTGGRRRLNGWSLDGARRRELVASPMWRGHPTTRSKRW